MRHYSPLPRISGIGRNRIEFSWHRTYSGMGHGVPSGGIAARGGRELLTAEAEPSSLKVTYP